MLSTPYTSGCRKAVILSEGVHGLIVNAAVEESLPLILSLFVPSSGHPKSVISTGGGALAAAVERPPHFAFAVACSQRQRRALYQPRATRGPRPAFFARWRGTPQVIAKYSPQGRKARPTPIREVPPEAA